MAAYDAAGPLLGLLSHNKIGFKKKIYLEAFS